jgi:hypothetical protein
MRVILACAAAMLVSGSAAVADPWRDESGNRGWRGADRDRFEHRQEQHGWRERQVRGIPRGHLPPPDECRIWYHGVPPGHQPPPYRCR